MRKILPLLMGLFIMACKKENPAPDPAPQPPAASMYFPPAGTNWETTTAASLGWNASAVDELYNFLQTKNTKAFIVLKEGRIVLEKYFDSFTADSIWYWASAGKTAAALLTGIAQEEGFLRLSDPVSQHLGSGWTSLTPQQEQQITVRHALTMTTGLDDGVADPDCMTPACLQYKAQPGTRWAYHNAPYTLLHQVVSNATGRSYTSYFNQKIRDRIGMNGTWISSGNNNVYYSTARSAARFGLLMLNKGKWNGSAILQDTAYFNAQVSTSQNLNLSYGYLTWLNGKASHLRPTTQFLFNGSMVPNAPADMYAALGKNDQKIYVVPSKGLVVVRMGNTAGNVNLALSSFDNELWGKLQNVF